MAHLHLTELSLKQLPKPVHILSMGKDTRSSLLMIFLLLAAGLAGLVFVSAGQALETILSMPLQVINRCANAALENPKALAMTKKRESAGMDNIKKGSKFKMNFEPLIFLKIHTFSKTKNFQVKMQKPNRTLLGMSCQRWLLLHKNRK